MKTAIMEWTGYLASIAGLLIVLLTFDRPGWAWPAGGAVLVLLGLLLIYRSKRRRRSDDGHPDDCGESIADDVADAMDGD
ncbi:hypothetical protein INH39_31900 [Massilia violaceinigra]|uniref:LPXTG cell wall anchor domain-containing protein n=1 Tax=Massilia violaceinigra TaxID=2045208 RepID=A0ABY4A555_9BURK|nr:hypothetical protein [Massilia violaceinigra]UOD29914.1 hypothetical protein INH39_31900 [Massilia violaceinigra]